MLNHGRRGRPRKLSSGIIETRIAHLKTKLETLVARERAVRAEFKSSKVREIPEVVIDICNDLADEIRATGRRLRRHKQLRTIYATRLNQKQVRRGFIAASA